MNILSMSGGGRAIGVAISDTRLYATFSSASGRAVTHEWALEPLARMATDWPSLSAAFTELRAQTPESHKALAIAILPPLVQLRRIELPKLAGAQLRQLLSRTAIKYFPNVREPQTVGAVMLQKGSPAHYLAASMSSRTLEVIVHLARAASWDVTTVVPAHEAWAAAATRRWAAVRKTSTEVAIPLHERVRDTAHAGIHEGVYVGVHEHVEVVQLEAGQLISTRRFRPDDVPHSAQSYTIEHAGHSAAECATATRGIEILPEVEYVRRAMARRKLLTRSAMAAVAAIVIVAGGMLWQARRELDAVMEERATLRASVAQVMGVQNDIAALTGPMSTLERIETQAPVWADVFVDMSSNLPRDAYITNFRAYGDSVSIEGLAARGATVFEAMNGAALIDSVRSSGPIRRQVRPGAKPMDQFTLSARVTNAAPLYSTQGKRLP